VVTLQGSPDNMAQCYRGQGIFPILLLFLVWRSGNGAGHIKKLSYVEPGKYWD